MISADIHTHTKFSADGTCDMEDMIKTAISLGLDHYGISEHFNYDYDRLGLLIDGLPVPPIDENAYFSCIRAMQKRYSGKIRLLAGAEFGYDHDPRTQERYLRTFETYKPDFVINSVHVCLGSDCYFPHYCEGKSKEFAYNAYLYRILESLDAAYPYDIVAHIGYCSRNATYPDPKLRMSKPGTMCNLSGFYAGCHSGTHVDAPLHFVDGAAAIDELPVERFVGKCTVVTLSGVLTGQQMEILLPFCEKMIWIP